MNKLSNRKVLVLGLGKSGIAALKLLKQYEVDVAVYDDSKQNSEEIEKIFNVRVIKNSTGLESNLFNERWDFIVKSPGIPDDIWYIEEFKKKEMPIISEIELGYICAPNHKYLAVTGTNGKTTTTTLIYTIFKKYYKDITFVAGNIGIPLCEVIVENELYFKNNCYVVLELSNFQLQYIHKFKPYISTILNLSPDHMDTIKTIDDYYMSKMNIIKNIDINDYFVLNCDDETIMSYTKDLMHNCNVKTFSLNNNDCNCYSTNNCIKENNEKIIDLNDLKICGPHNIKNAMVAICFAKICGIPNSIIKNTLINFNGVEHRMEFVIEKNGVYYYNDSKATNVEATEYAVKSFDAPIILLLGGYEKNLDISPLKKHLNKIKAAIGFGMCGQRLVNELLPEKGIITETLFEAVSAAKTLAKPGDIILLSPTTSSFDQFSCFEERGNTFKEIARHS